MTNLLFYFGVLVIFTEVALAGVAPQVLARLAFLSLGNDDFISKDKLTTARLTRTFRDYRGGIVPVLSLQCLRGWRLKAHSFGVLVDREAEHATVWMSRSWPFWRGIARLDFTIAPEGIAIRARRYPTGLVSVVMIAMLSFLQPVCMAYAALALSVAVTNYLLRYRRQPAFDAELAPSSLDVTVGQAVAELETRLLDGDTDETFAPAA